MVPFGWVTPSPHELGLAVILACAATGGQYLTVLAYRRAAASLLAPFSYAQLIWASAFGFVLFANVPDFWTGIGAAVIIASGLYTVHRERVRAREARTPSLTLSAAERNGTARLGSQAARSP